MAHPGPATSRHNLLTIPTEILQRIAQQADPADLPSLRLVSREVAAKIEPAFIKTHFTSRAFFMGHWVSLVTLRDIANSRKHGPSMKKITIYVDKVLAPRQPHLSSTAHHSVNKRAINHFVAHRGQFSAQEGLRSQNRDVEFLTRAFNSFKVWGNKLHIDISFQHRKERPGKGYRDRIKFLEAGTGHDSICYATAVLQCIVKSDLPVEKLTIYGDHYSCSKPFTQAVALNLESKSGLLHHLKRLTLKTEVNLFRSDRTRELRGLLNLLRSSTVLEELEIQTPRFLDRRIAMEKSWTPLFHTQFQGVKKLSFKNFHFTIELFIQFICIQPALQNLELDCIKFHDPEDWYADPRNKRFWVVPPRGLLGIRPDRLYRWLKDVTEFDGNSTAEKVMQLEINEILSDDWEEHRGSDG